jgi:phage shock protein A
LKKENKSNTKREEKINNLEKTISQIREEQVQMEKEKEDQANKIKKWKSKALGFEQEKNFL